MKTANVKGLAVKGMIGAVAMGALIFAGSAQAHAQGFAVGVQFGAPAYVTPGPAYYPAPAYYGDYPARHEAFVRHEEREAFERREAIRHEQFERAREFDHRFDRNARGWR